MVYSTAGVRDSEMKLRLSFTHSPTYVKIKFTLNNYQKPRKDILDILISSGIRHPNNEGHS